MPMLKEAAAFIDSGELKTLYGISPTNTTSLNLLYTNAMRRAANMRFWGSRSRQRTRWR